MSEIQFFSFWTSQCTSQNRNPMFLYLENMYLYLGTRQPLVPTDRPACGRVLRSVSGTASATGPIWPPTTACVHTDVLVASAVGLHSSFSDTNGLRAPRYEAG